ncbi:MAG: 3'-phosphoesterase [Nocardioides sp.]|nr:3'-phosphoesterase [Nocardioides sp.]
MCSDRPMFVVQLHQATTLHHDLRLEVDGVLVSWAVPKGPSPEPGVKRLAVKVGDHDLAHAQVEGVQGSGWVEIWDRGVYDNLTERDGVAVQMTAGLAAGHVTVRLRGERLNGVFALIRTRMGGDDRAWLLIALAAPEGVRISGA